MNYDNICKFSSNAMSSISATHNCQQVSKGILEKGLRTAIVALIESNKNLFIKRFERYIEFI